MIENVYYGTFPAFRNVWKHVKLQELRILEELEGGV
jgi:hypothetical protein